MQTDTPQRGTRGMFGTPFTTVLPLIDRLFCLLQILLILWDRYANDAAGCLYRSTMAGLKFFSVFTSIYVNRKMKHNSFVAHINS